MATAKEGVSGGILTPNEARRRFDLKPIDGGETAYLQEQNWPLRLLAGRELPARPPTVPAPIVPPTAPIEPPDKSFDWARVKARAIVKAVELVTQEADVAA